VAYEDLEIGDVIGKGCSGIVVAAVHKPTGTPLALKVRCWRRCGVCVLRVEAPRPPGPRSGCSPAGLGFEWDREREGGGD
jgi:hypothetical protein